MRVNTSPRDFALGNTDRLPRLSFCTTPYLPHRLPCILGLITWFLGTLRHFFSGCTIRAFWWFE
ncbi:hypothetical protein EBZ35_00540 [bacterium]|nr:hypothetical protein [bacterium]